VSAADHETDATDAPTEPVDAVQKANAQLERWAQVQLAAACREAYESGRAMVLPALCLGALSGFAVGLIAGALLF
jgi:hypothetical protein